jgi:hypothetical protein
LLNMKNKKKIILCSSSLYILCQPIVSEFVEGKSAGIRNMWRDSSGHCGWLYVCFNTVCFPAWSPAFMYKKISVSEITFRPLTPILWAQGLYTDPKDTGGSIWSCVLVYPSFNCASLVIAPAMPSHGHFACDIV